MNHRTWIKIRDKEEKSEQKENKTRTDSESIVVSMMWLQIEVTR